MKKEHKIILGLALIAVGGWMYWQSQQPKAVATTATPSTTTPPASFSGEVGNVQK